MELKLMRRQCLHIIALAIAVASLSPVLSARAENGGTEKTVRIPWEEVEGSIRYEVVIRDGADREVFSSSVTAAFVEFALPPGRYRIRIIPINKFNKAGTPSDWEEFEIAELPPAMKIRSKTVFKLSAGIPYSRAGSPWNEKLDDSFRGGTLCLGIYSTLGFFRFTGFEIEAGAVQFPGKENTDSLSNLSLGGNLYFTTGFDFPLNLILRGGGGITASRLLYMSDISGKETLLWSSFPYIKAGASLEWYVARDFFLEGGADYSITRLKGEPLKTTGFFLRAGYRLRWAPDETGEEEKEEGGDKKPASFPLVFSLAAGPVVIQTSPVVDDVKKSSFAGAQAALGVIGRRGFLRFIGLEADTAWVRFDGSGGITRSLTWSLTGGGVALRTAFDFPLNVLARIGGGIAVSGLEYTEQFNFRSKTVWSEKAYYRAGGALEYNVYKGLYAELGGDYLMGIMTYDGGDVNAIRYFLRIGVKI